MSRLCWIAVSLSLVACKGKAKEQAAETPPPATGSAPAPADAAAAPTGDAGAAKAPGCEGWRAEKLEHLGMGQIKVTVECAGDKITLTSVTEGARDDEPKTEKKMLVRDAWVRLWQELEDANWRALDPKCPPVKPPPESTTVTELELTISDGVTTKQVTCHGLDLTTVHHQIMDAIDAAAK